jgi:hypothetical protein
MMWASGELGPARCPGSADPSLSFGDILDASCGGADVTAATMLGGGGTDARIVTSGGGDKGSGVGVPGSGGGSAGGGDDGSAGGGSEGTLVPHITLRCAHKLL